MKERKMNENLRDKIAEVMGFAPDCENDPPCAECRHAQAMTEDVLAVVGPELDRLRAEVERLEAKLRQPCGSCHPCTEWANQTWVNAGKRLPHAHEWDEVLAERDDLRARLAKVEALGDGRWDHSWGCSAHSGGECDCWLSALRAVLASVPEPSDSEPVRATGAIVTERQRCICAVICLDHCRACNYSGRDLEEGCIRLDADEDEPSDSEPAPAAAAFALKVAEQQMCPNCVTPWKCNGPHIEQPAPDADRRPHSRACGIKRHDHGPDCHRNCPTCGGAS